MELLKFYVICNLLLININKIEIVLKVDFFCCTNVIIKGKLKEVKVY